MSCRQNSRVQENWQRSNHLNKILVFFFFQRREVRGSMMMRVYSRFLIRNLRKMGLNSRKFSRRRLSIKIFTMNSTLSWKIYHHRTSIHILYRVPYRQRRGKEFANSRLITHGRPRTTNSCYFMLTFFSYQIKPEDIHTAAAIAKILYSPHTDSNPPRATFTSSEPVRDTFRKHGRF